jgi:hypothetical protein
MKFLLTYQGNTHVPPSAETMAAIGKLTREMIDNGTVLMTGGLVRPNNGTRLKYDGAKHTVIDGPFPETKELIDGFALVHCDSKQEAIELAQRFMSVAGQGDGEVLQVFDGAEGGPPGCD